MDIFILEKVFALKDVIPAQKMVLLAFANARSIRFSLKDAVKIGAVRNNQLLGEANRILTSGCVDPLKVKRISKMTNYTIRQIRNILKDLQNKGLLKRNEDGTYALQDKLSSYYYDGGLCFEQ